MYFQLTFSINSEYFPDIFPVLLQYIAGLHIPRMFLVIFHFFPSTCLVLLIMCACFCILLHKLYIFLIVLLSIACFPPFFVFFSYWCVLLHHISVPLPTMALVYIDPTGYISHFYGSGFKSNWPAFKLLKLQPINSVQNWCNFSPIFLAQTISWPGSQSDTLVDS